MNAKKAKAARRAVATTQVDERPRHERRREVRAARNPLTAAHRVNLKKKQQGDALRKFFHQAQQYAPTIAVLRALHNARGRVGL